MRRLLAVLSGIILITSSAKAGIKDYLDKFVVETPADSSGVFDSQTRRYYVGGRFTVQAPRTVIQPFSVIPPKIEVGCGGIDIVTGSFSYLRDGKYWESFAKSVFNPGTVSAMAFDIALGALCEKCSSTIKKLTSLANQINSMNFDSCKIATAISNNLKERLAGTEIARSIKGKTSDWLSGADKFLDNMTDLVSEFNTSINCTGFACKVAKKLTDTDSFLHDLLEDTDMYDPDLEDILRAYIGDFRIDTGAEEPVVPIRKNDENVNENAMSVVKILTGYDDNSGTCSSLASVKGLDKSGAYVTVTNYNPACVYAQDAVTDVFNAIRYRIRPRATTIEFINRFDVPVYSLLNTFSLVPDQVRDGVKADLVRLFAAEYAYEILSNTLNAINEKLAYVRYQISPELRNTAYGEGLEGNLEIMQKNTLELLKEVSKFYGKAHDKFIKDMQNQKFYEELNKEIMQAMGHSPIAGAYLLSLGINKI
ncbi:conjugal transfer protein TraH [Desulfurobacterium sp. TC5-1]|uniref:conjugal transfer protein TraH n=1 Tax=Desulfurobacterium sp. TC5-1 TaxID=1158318 RepID=UPI0003B4D0FB|nr:conjugal transfer protein TraH [Desulfurobacterium sp. TC5-1]